MRDGDWGLLAVHVRDLAYGQGERAARAFAALAEDPQSVARSLADKWETIPPGFLAAIIPAPPALRSRAQFRSMVNGVRRRHAPGVPGVAGMNDFDQQTLFEVYFEALFEGFQAGLDLIGSGQGSPSETTSRTSRAGAAVREGRPLSQGGRRYSSFTGS